MIDFMLSLSTWVGSLFAMLFSTVCGLVVYLVSYKLIPKYSSDELKDPTSNLFRLVGLLVGLMLSLAFAEVVVELRAIENSIKREAVAVSDVYKDLQLYDVEETQEIRSLLISYTQSVIENDWPSLANDILSQRTTDLHKQIQEGVMGLEPIKETQKHLWSRIIADLDTVSDYRLYRLDSALAEPPVYIYVVFFGFLVTMACFGAYRPQISLVVLVSLYTVFVGLVLYLILALSDPFQGATSVSPSTFEYLLETFRTE